MRIRSLFIEGFGIFNQLWLKDLSKGLTVFLGDNEAGKSTLLSFLRTMFFGFVPGRSRENKYPPIAGGRHGGRVEIIADSGTELLLERYFGPGGGILLTGPDGAQLSVQDLQSLIGGITREVYRNVYAFSLEELQSFHNLENDDIKAAIYGAAIGAGQADLGRIESYLGKRMETLFKPRGSKSDINRLLSELDSLRKKIRHASGQTDRYRKLLLDLEEVEKDIKGTEEQAGLLDQERRCLDILQEVWAQWREVTSLESQIARLQQEHAEYKAVLENEPDILEFKEHKGAYVQLLSELPDLKAQLESERDAVTRYLISLGSEWTEERVRSFDYSLFTRQTLESFSAELDKGQDRQKKAQHQYDAIQDSLKNAEHRLWLSNRRLEKAENLKLELDREVLKRLRSRRDHVYELWAGLQEKRRLLSEAEQGLQRALKDIDPGWSPGDLERLDASPGIQEEVLRLAQELQNARSEIDRIEHDIQRLESDVTACEERLRLRQASMQTLKPDDRTDTDEIFGLQHVLNDLSRIVQESEMLGRELEILSSRVQEKERELKQAEKQQVEEPDSMTKWLSWALILAGPLGAAACMFYQKYTWALFGALVLVSGLYLFRAWKKQSALSTQAKREKDLRIHGLEQDLSVLKDEHRGVQDRHAALLERRNSLAADLGISGICTLDEIARLDERFKKNLFRLYRLENDKAGVAELDQRLDSLRRELNALEARKMDAVSIMRSKRKIWEDLLSRFGFSIDLDPRGVSRILSRIERARSLVRRVRDLEREISKTEDEIGGYVALARSLGRLSESAFQDFESFFSALDFLFLKWDEGERALEREKALRESLEEAREEVQRCQREVQDAQACLEQATDDLGEIRMRFRQWLNGLGLPEDLSAGAAREALEILEKCLDALGNRDRILYRIREIEKIKTDFENRVERLLQTLGLQMDVLPGLDRAAVLLQKAAETAEREREVRWKLDHITGTLRGQWDSLQQILENISEDLKGDPKWNEILNLIFRKEMVLVLKEIGAPAFSRFEKMRAALDGQASALKRDLQALFEKKAELVHEQKGLVSSEELLDLRNQEEELLQHIRSLSMEWAVFASANYLLRQARKRFEEEYQPRVLQDASRFFKTITRDRYAKVLAPLDSSGIKAMDAEGRLKSPEILSRGTAEQLYLSLRFGYILNYSFGRERLPVVMDDILVNFDAMRALNAVKTISALSQERQVFYFTCHSHMADLFREVDESASFYKIEGGNILAWT